MLTLLNPWSKGVYYVPGGDEPRRTRSKLVLFDPAVSEEYAAWHADDPNIVGFDWDPATFDEEPAFRGSTSHTMSRRLLKRIVQSDEPLR